MQRLITITRQWQIYLPEEIRNEINLEKPGKATIDVEKEKIVIRPLKSRVLSLAGVLKNNKPKKKIKTNKK